MTELQFRKAVTEDLADIIDMLADDPLGREREDTSRPIPGAYVEALAAIDSDPNQFLAVAEMDSCVVGCLQLSFIPGLSRLGAWRGLIESVRVADSHQGQGIGRRFFEWAIAECRSRNCRMVQLTTDKTRPDARSFYESLGFTASHDGMKLSLSEA